MPLFFPYWKVASTGALEPEASGQEKPASSASAARDDVALEEAGGVAEDVEEDVEAVVGLVVAVLAGAVALGEAGTVSTEEPTGRVMTPFSLTTVPGGMTRKT